MDEYDIFREQSPYFKPKTPVAALKAYEGNFIPISIFTFKSNSTKPLDEEPYDIDEIERLLSRKNLTLQTNIILIEIFEKLIFSEDQEIALFAAESINIIENRYNKQIQSIKEDKSVNDSAERTGELAVLFYELAILNKKRDAIKLFFLKESYSFYQKLRKLRKLSNSEFNTLFKILLELKKLDIASDLLEKEYPEDSAFSFLLTAEVEFAKKNFKRVKEICRKLTEHISDLTEKEFVLISYWMGA